MDPIVSLALCPRIDHCNRDVALILSGYLIEYLAYGIRIVRGTTIGRSGCALVALRLVNKTSVLKAPRIITVCNRVFEFRIAKNDELHIVRIFKGRSWRFLPVFLKE